MTSAPTVAVDELPDRPGWVVVTLTGPFGSPPAARLLGATLIELFQDGTDTVSIDAGACQGLSSEACDVLAEAARQAHRAGGCLVATGLTARDRAVLERYDALRRLAIIR